MSVLVKCNASDLLSTDPFSVTLLAEKNCEPKEGDEVYVWTSELPRKGRLGIGLEARGDLLQWRRLGAKAMLTARLVDRSPKVSLGMNDLARRGRELAAAHRLYDRIHKFRLRRIWSLAEDEIEFLRSAFGITQATNDDLYSDIENIVNDPSLSGTTKTALIEARKGQGRFRRGLEQRWNYACAFTGCRVAAALRASHIKPWHRSSDAERLDPKNGLLLAAHIDALFDRGLISFDDDGKLLLAKEVSAADAELLGLSGQLRSKLDRDEKNYLRFHRETHNFAK